MGLGLGEVSMIATVTIFILILALGLFSYHCIGFDFLEYVAKKENLKFRVVENPLSTKVCPEISFGFIASTVGCVVHFYRNNEVSIQERFGGKEIVFDLCSFHIERRHIDGAPSILGRSSGLRLEFNDRDLEKEVAAWLGNPN